MTTLVVACRALALTVEELRALLAVVLGISNIVLLFVNRTTAAEQLAHDKAKLNLSVLQKQVIYISEQQIASPNLCLLHMRMRAV